VKLFVAVPSYDGRIPIQLVQSLNALDGALPCPVTIKLLGGNSLVPAARNVLAADFLETDCTHLLFVDSDIVFTPEQVARLLAHNEAIVGGLYAKKKKDPLEWVVNIFPGQSTADGLLPVRHIGLGFLLIGREVLEKMIEKLGPEIRYNAYVTERQEWDFFPVGPRDDVAARRYFSEDWGFCRRALDLGFTLCADTGVKLEHFGTASYPLRSQTASIS
jgi:hypothetical protein